MRLPWQVFRLDAEVMAFVVRYFMRQLVDLGLAPDEFVVLLGEQATQFVGIELIEIGGQRHPRIMPADWTVGYRGLP